MAKANINTVNQRVILIANMLVEGKSRSSIIHYSSDNWNIGERQVDKYISKAREIITKETIRNLEFDYAKAIKRYEDLYRKALEIEDYRLALAVNKEISNLQGLNKVQIEHSGNIEFISNIPD